MSWIKQLTMFAVQTGLTIITQCQERPKGISVKQWLSDNGVKEKAYYYWLRKFRKEAYEQMQLPVTNKNPGTAIAFTEITMPAKTVPPCVPSPAEPYAWKSEQKHS